MVATRISDDGVIIGSDESSTGVMWTTDDDPFVYLAPAEPFYTQVRDINALDIALGQIGAPPQTVLWTDPETYNVLSVPTDATANALNDSEMVVGSAPFGARVHGFRWTLDGGSEDLGDLPGGNDKSVANDVNNFGQVVGAGNSVLGQRAVLWDADGTIHDLGNLPNNPAGAQYSATRINNVGEVIGSVSFRRSNYSPWLWTAGTGMLSIGSLIDPNDPLYRAGTFNSYGLNDAGMLVGGLYPRRGTDEIPVLLVPEPLSPEPEPTSGGPARTSGLTFDAPRLLPTTRASIACRREAAQADRGKPARRGDLASGPTILLDVLLEGRRPSVLTGCASDAKGCSESHA